MAKPKLHTRQQVDALTLLAGLPSKVGPLTRKETAVVLLNAVRKALQLGYTLPELRDMLRERVGVFISLSQMQRLLDISSEGANETASPPPSAPPDGGTARHGKSLAAPSSTAPAASSGGGETAAASSTPATEMRAGKTQNSSMADAKGGKESMKLSSDKDDAGSREGWHGSPARAAAGR